MLLSIVIPVCNEGEVVPATLAAIRQTLSGLGCDYEILFVDDGSVDDTARILQNEAAAERRIKLIQLSRNFGHQVAITAGLDFASGDAVVVMDADLQDPPSLISPMLALYSQGWQVVSPQRVARLGESALKRWSASAFYWLMEKMVDPRLRPEVSDFRLFSREAVQVLRGFREQHRFMRGLVAWLGLRETTLPFERAPRVAGATKYSLFKMIRLAITAISSFSALPLRICSATGIALTGFGVGYTCYSLYRALVQHAVVQGWTSIVCLQLLFSGAILVAIGTTGEYVARIYEQGKQRPLYVVNGLVNVDLAQRQIERAAVIAGPQHTRP
jgi:polyisoprenyl-phosphate glycosyltransferase